MPKRRDYESLADIQEAIVNVAEYIKGLSFEQFLKDRKTRDAVIRNLEVIGEAAKNLSASLRKMYPEMPWKELAGMRDKMIHDYFGINYEIVWSISNEKLLDLFPQITEILKHYSPK